MMKATTMSFRAKSSSARTMIRSVSACICVAFLSSLGHATTVWDLENVLIDTTANPGDPVVGSLDIILGMTDADVVAAFNFDVLVDENGPISFTGISNPSDNPLFANPTLTPDMLGANVRGTGDSSTTSALADGLSVVTLEFTAPAGTLGLFPVDFGIAQFNNLSNQAGDMRINPVLNAGSIEIVPEPTTCLLVSMAALFGLLGCRRKLT